MEKIPKKIKQLMDDFIKDFKFDCYAAGSYYHSSPQFAMMVWWVTDSLFNSKDREENRLCKKYKPLVEYLDLIRQVEFVGGPKPAVKYMIPDSADFEIHFHHACALMDYTSEAIGSWRPEYKDAVEWMHSRHQETVNLLKWHFDMSHPKSDEGTHSRDYLRGYYECVAELLLWILIDKVLEEDKNA